jgi:hypothetical protein
MVRCLFAALLLFAVPLVSAQSSIFWVSEPVAPGETALIAFSGAPASTAYGRQNSSSNSQWVALDTNGTTKYGLTATVPSNFTLGEFELKLSSGDPFTANVARPWYLFGDAGSSSTPGGHVRVVGDAIGLSRTPLKNTAYLHITTGDEQAARDGSAQVLSIAARNTAIEGSSPTRSHALFDLPRDLKPGIYPVAVSNSASGTRTPLCTFIDPSTPCLR